MLLDEGERSASRPCRFTPGRTDFGTRVDMWTQELVLNLRPCNYGIQDAIIFSNFTEKISQQICKFSKIYYRIQYQDFTLSNHIGVTDCKEIRNARLQ
jgi:hypothetical protein